MDPAPSSVSPPPSPLRSHWYQRWHQSRWHAVCHWGILVLIVFLFLLVFLRVSSSYAPYLDLTVSRPSEAGRPVAIEGVLEVLHSDDFEQDRSAVHYHLRTDAGEVFTLHFPEPPLIPPQARIRVRAPRNNNDITITSPVGAEGTTDDSGQVEVLETSTEESTGTAVIKKVAVILFNFQDTPTTQPITPDQARQTMFTSTTSARAYYEEISFGQVSLAGKTRSDGDVFGWYTIPYNSTDNCTTTTINTWAQAANTQAQNAGVDLSGYDNIQYAFAGSTNCAWAGWAYFSHSRSWVNLKYGYKTAIVAHELGHNYGTHHASSRNCTEGGQRVFVSTSCTNKEYGDPFDIMGTGNTRHFNNYHKGEVRYLVPANTQDVTASGTYTIVPIERASASGVQSLRIKKDSTNYYYLEYRQPSGTFDNFGTTAPVVNGVSIRLAPDYSVFRQSWLLDATSGTTSFGDAALPVGQTVSDAALGLSITTLAVSPSEATVGITLAAAAASPSPSPSLTPSASPSPTTTDTTPPTVALTKPLNGSTIARRSTVTLEATASDDVGVAKVDFLVDGKLTCSDTASPYGCAWRVPASNSGKAYTITAQAYDAAANSATSTVQVTAN
ncbi:MAG: Ig-like domain-containing protein [Candidatus Andersenbacteria bacterium]